MKTTLILTLTSLLLGATSTFGQTLMLDFGPTTVAGTDRLNSPLNTATGYAGESWNKVQLTDVNSLVYGDGSAATGVVLNLGAIGSSGNQTSSVINLASQPQQTSVLGAQQNSGVYAGTSVGTDGIFNGFSAGERRPIGFQLGGLAAGVYDIYVTARNTNAAASAAYTQQIVVGTTATSGNFDFSGYSNTAAITYGSAYTSAWVQGQNYQRLTFTLGAGEFLNLAVFGTGVEARGFLNSVQITAVPEPESVALLAVAGLAFLIVVRRRQKSCAS